MTAHARGSGQQILYLEEDLIGIAQMCLLILICAWAHVPTCPQFLEVWYFLLVLVMHTCHQQTSRNCRHNGGHVVLVSFLVMTFCKTLHDLYENTKFVFYYVINQINNSWGSYAHFVQLGHG